MFSTWQWLLKTKVFHGDFRRGFELKRREVSNYYSNRLLFLLTVSTPEYSRLTS